MPARDVRRSRHSSRSRHRAGRRQSGLRWGLAVLAVALAAAGVAVLSTWTSGPPAPPADPPATASRAPATPPAADLVAWAARELPADARLRAAPGVRADLLAAGVPGVLLATDEPTSPDGVVLEVVSGEPPPGARVLARFGGLLVVDPTPGVPTSEQLDRRRTLAAALLANPTVRVGEQAGEVLRDADVDARLLMLLAALGAQQGVGVASFPGVSGDGGPPARTVLLDSFGGAPLGTGAAGTDTLRAWLDAQLPPFAPDDVTVTDEGVVIGHRYLSDPDAAVSAAGP